MTKAKRLVAILGFVAAFCLLVPLGRAQEPPPPEPEPEPPAPTTAETTPPPQPSARTLGIYVAVGGGMGSADDIDLSIETSALDIAQSTLQLSEVQHGIAALGWQFSEGRGDIRLTYNGYGEDNYEFHSRGRSRRLLVGGSVLSPVLLDWWNLNIEDGQLTSQQTPFNWIEDQDDENGNGTPDVEEIRELPVTIRVERNAPEVLQNQIETVDLLYGREFGGRRFGSRWWGGLRYFQYNGNIPAGAWLTTGESAGVGFTSGAFTRLLNFYHDASGYGPSGSWEVDFKFLDEMVEIFGRAQGAFLFNKLESDTGTFFTLIRRVGGEVTPAAARLHDKRDKSSWQTTGELGARLHLRNGLSFELAVTRSGFLDIVLTPLSIAVPENQLQALEGVSAIYRTRDIVIDTWHGGVSFQF